MPRKTTSVIQRFVGPAAKSYGILPGAFNPPTEAHLALARSALTTVDQVIFVLPRSMPHKDYSGVPFETRLSILLQLIDGHPRFSVANTKGGLFIDIARELRTVLPEGAELNFLCGRDAAERIVNWPYQEPDSCEAMLQEFALLVAPRDGDYAIPDRYSARIANLTLAPEYQVMSATDVRERILSGLDWEYLVPPRIRDQVRSLYSGESARKSL